MRPAPPFRHLLVIAAMLTVATAVAAGEAFTGTCTKVVDGDTLVVQRDGQRVTVQLVGVDAPELGEPMGKEIFVFVRQMVQWTDVSVTVDHWDGDTAFARVEAGGEDLSTLLVRHGLASVTGDPPDAAELEALALRARRVPSGIWLHRDPARPQSADASTS